MSVSTLSSSLTKKDGPLQSIQLLPMFCWSALCLLSLGVAVFFLLSTGVHDIATFEGRWIGRCSPKSLFCYMSMNLLEPVLSKVSSLVAWSWHVMCKILRRRHTNRNCGKRSTSCTGFEHSDFIVNCSSVEINMWISSAEISKQAWSTEEETWPEHVVHEGH